MHRYARNARPRSPRPSPFAASAGHPARIRRRMVAVLSAVGLGATGVSVAVTHATSAGAASNVYTQNIADSFDRKSGWGMGKAPTGGSYAVIGRTSVAGSSAVFGPAPSGVGVQATLSDISVADERLQAAWQLRTKPTSGTKIYLSLDLRRQRNDDRYRAVVVVTAGGKADLSLVQRAKGRDRQLTDWQTVPGLVRPGATLVVTADITGSVVKATGQVSGQSKGVSVTGTDNTATRIANAGRFGISMVNTAKSPKAEVGVQWLRGWKITTKTGPKPPATTPGAPAPVAGRGSIAVGKTDYPVPTSNVVVVSPDGDDKAAGTTQEPVKTVARAVTLASSGDTVVLRGGVYHQTVSVPASKRLTIQSWPGEAVWFDGSSAVDGFESRTVRGRPVWVHEGWTAKFDSTAGYNAAQAASFQWLNPRYPLAAHPDQAYIDGAALTQVAAIGDLTTGTFYVDYDTDQLYLGSDPTGHSVRASDLSLAISVTSPGSKLRGLGVRRYATSVPQMGTVTIGADGQTIENVVITQNAAQGLRVRGTGVEVNHVTVTDNGLLGVQAHLTDGLVVGNSVISNNNSQHFNFAPVSGGLKVTTSRDVTVRNNEAAGNDGTGLWFDESVYDMKVLSNTSTGNTRNGVLFELCSRAVVANNVLTHNSYDAIRVADTGSVRIWNNTIGWNKVRNVEIVQDLRTNTRNDRGHDPRRPFPDPTMPWVTADVSVGNNVFIGGGQYHVYVYDAPNKRLADGMNVRLDGNVMSAPNGRAYAPVAWQTAADTITRFYLFSTYLAHRKDGSSNVLSGGYDEGQMAGDIRNSTTAVPMPSEIATLLGLKSGVRHNGSF